MGEPQDPSAPARADQERPPVRLRESFEGLPAYVPGAAGGPEAFKLSSNEVPFPPSSAVISAVADAAEDANRYPQMYADRLAAAIAAEHDQLPERVLVGNGSVSLVELALRAMCAPGDEVVYAWRSFEAYPILVQVTGARSVQVDLTPEGEHDLTAMAAAIGPRTRAVILCTPNNPTGAALTHTAVRAFLEQVPSDVMVILDEAYVHFDRTDDRLDSLPLLGVYKNLLILRTFSKAYGMAGLRVGYALARRRLVRSLTAASTPFGVNLLGQAAALAALSDAETMVERVGAVIAERERVMAALADQGWAIPHTQANFYWLPLGEQASAFAAEAQSAGVMVRPFAGDGVRVTIGEPEANDIALTVAARWAQRGAETP